MKWFHHECSARHDPKLHLFLRAFGAEGWGVYWGLLEQIGHHSDTFHLKVTGVSAESDQAYVDVFLREEGATLSPQVLDGADIPIIELGILARLLFSTREKLLRVVGKLVELGVFDQGKWHKYGLLYSPSFERRADDYTRRRRRLAEQARTPFQDPRDNARTHSEDSPEIVGHEPEQPQQQDDQLPENVLTHAEHTPANVKHNSESIRERADTSPRNVGPEQEETEKKRKKQKEKESRRENLCSVPAAFELSTVYPRPPVRESRDDAALIPSAEYFTEMCAEFREIIREWNDQEKSSIDWTPTRDELKKLFYGGDAAHKLRVCREASNLTGGKPDFPGLVIRALNLMLEASKKQRIQNPFGWVWSCLHGSPEGMSPWVHLLTAPEEARRISAPRSPP